MKFRLSHIGLVVQNVPKFSKLFRALGFDEVTQPEPNPIQKVVACFLKAGESVYIELLEPMDDHSPITTFLKRRGGGLHNLCFEVDDIDSVSNELIVE